MFETLSMPTVPARVTCTVGTKQVSVSSDHFCIRRRIRQRERERERDTDRQREEQSRRVRMSSAVLHNTRKPSLQRV